MGIITKTFVECELGENWIDEGFKVQRFKTTRDSKGRQQYGFGMTSRKIYTSTQPKAEVTLTRKIEMNKQRNEVIGYVEVIRFIDKDAPILLGENSISYRKDETETWDKSFQSVL